MDCKCLVITHQSTSEDTSLSSNQEEADTKVILHCHAILVESSSSIVTLRSPSGDTDIVILAMTLLHEFNDRVILDDGSGKNRKLISLKEISIEEEIIEALIGFHAYTGNDYVSSFFRKGKDTCFKVLEKSSKFQRAFSRLGEDWQLSDELFSKVEEFVCYLYGSRLKDINLLRFNMYTKKYIKENKIIDMCSLPPCRSVLKLHSMRANFVAAIWKRSISPNVEPPEISESGWLPDGSVRWINDAYPRDIEDIFFDDEYDGEYECGEEGDSDIED